MAKNIVNFKFIMCAISLALAILLLGVLCSCNKTNYQEISSETLKTAQNFPTGNTLTCFGEADKNATEMKAVETELNSILKQGKMISFVVINTKDQSGFSYDADRVCVGKSTIKAPYITSLLMNDNSIFKNDKEAIKKAITYSDNNSYKYLRTKYGNEIFINFCSSVGVDVSKCEENFPRNMTTRDLVKMWSKMYPFLKENANTNNEIAEFVDYFKCSAYSPFSTLFWRENEVYSKAGWDEGISVNEQTGLLSKIPDANMIDGDPLNNEEAMNDTGIVCAQNGDYIFAYFSDFPAITDLMYPLIQAIHNAEININKQKTNQ